MINKSLIYEAKKELEIKNTKQKALNEAVKHAVIILKTQGLKYQESEIKKKISFLSKKYNFEEDVGKLFWYLKEKANLKPSSIDHFWGYTVRAFQFPPFEPISHVRARNGKKPFSGDKWRFLMKIKRYPQTIKEPPPKWLEKALLLDLAFAKIYELQISVAREILSELVSGDAFLDTCQVKFISGKPIINTNLKEVLKKLEEI